MPKPKEKKGEKKEEKKVEVKVEIKPGAENHPDYDPSLPMNKQRHLR